MKTFPAYRDKYRINIKDPYFFLFFRLHFYNDLLGHNFHSELLSMVFKL